MGKKLKKLNKFTNCSTARKDSIEAIGWRDSACNCLYFSWVSWGFDRNWCWKSVKWCSTIFIDRHKSEHKSAKGDYRVLDWVYFRTRMKIITKSCPRSLMRPYSVMYMSPTYGGSPRCTVVRDHPCPSYRSTTWSKGAAFLFFLCRSSKLKVYPSKITSIFPKVSTEPVYPWWRETISQETISVDNYSRSILGSASVAQTEGSFWRAFNQLGRAQLNPPQSHPMTTVNVRECRYPK